MTEAILNQAWEDVADDVTGAIEKAVEPLLKKAVDGIYGGLLEATQDYLKDNLAFNIASRISAAERELRDARQRADLYKAERDELLLAAIQYRDDMRYPPDADSLTRRMDAVVALIAKVSEQ